MRSYNGIPVTVRTYADDGGGRKSVTVSAAAAEGTVLPAHAWNTDNNSQVVAADVPSTYEEPAKFATTPGWSF